MSSRNIFSEKEKRTLRAEGHDDGCVRVEDLRAILEKHFPGCLDIGSSAPPLHVQPINGLLNIVALIAK